MVFEHQHEHESQWATIESISGKIGCTAETPEDALSTFLRTDIDALVLENHIVYKLAI